MKLGEWLYEGTEALVAVGHLKLVGLGSFAVGLLIGATASDPDRALRLAEQIISGLF